MRGKIVVCYNLNDSESNRRYQLEKTLEKYDFEKVKNRDSVPGNVKVSGYGEKSQEDDDDFEKVKNIDTLWEKESDDYEFEKVEKELLADLKKDMKEKYKDESVFDSPELYINIYFSRLNNTSKKIDREGKTI